MKRSHSRVPAALLAFALAAVSGSALAQPVLGAMTFTVNRIGDGSDINLANSRCDVKADAGDQCTLRAAIQQANSTSGPDTINFNIPTAPRIIRPGAIPLPVITERMTINGYSQSGTSINTQADSDNAVLRIVLDGLNAGPNAIGLNLQASNSVIRGLAIQRWHGAGVVVAGNNNHVRGNFIGTNLAGNTALGNATGIRVTGANNFIGAATLGARNLISGNDDVGVSIEGETASGNRVEGNFIGTAANGSVALPNGNGVLVSNAPSNTIGGTSAGARNVISGNDGGGVGIGSDGDNLSVVQGNFIGTDATGTQDLGNASSGVSIGGDAITIGGISAGARNVISANGGHGISVFAGVNPVRERNIIQGNYIGTNAAGNGALGNDLSGISIFGGRQTQIGGTIAGARNVISANGGHGVSLFGPDSDDNRVEGNFIGTRADGTGDLGNAINGVSIAGGNDRNTIGTSVSGAGNRISGNAFAGVSIEDAGSQDGGSIANIVAGNSIVANDGDGVSVADGPSFVNVNSIIQNGGDGIFVDSAASGVSMLFNQLLGNAELGIDLEGGTENGFGVTANDTDDPDTGANGLQNFPVLTNAVRAQNGVTTVIGSLNSTPNRGFRIDLYVAAPDPSGHGETLAPIATKNVTTNASGDVGFSFQFGSLAPGQRLTAAATRPSFGTSELSSNMVVVQQP